MIRALFVFLFIIVHRAPQPEPDLVQRLRECGGL